MKFQALVRMATTLALLYAGISVLPGNVYAQVIDFSQIDAFKSMGTGTLQVRHHRRLLSMTTNGTQFSLRSGNQILTPRFIGNRSTKTFLEQRSKWTGRPCIPDCWGI